MYLDDRLDGRFGGSCSVSIWSCDTFHGISHSVVNGFVIVNGFSEPIVAAAAVMFVGIIALIIAGVSR